MRGESLWLGQSLDAKAWRNHHDSIVLWHHWLVCTYLRIHSICISNPQSEGHPKTSTRSLCVWSGPLTWTIVVAAWLRSVCVVWFFLSKLQRILCESVNGTSCHDLPRLLCVLQRFSRVLPLVFICIYGWSNRWDNYLDVWEQQTDVKLNIRLFRLWYRGIR